MPELTLEAISFRPGDPVPGSPLPLRFDAFRIVPVPEWVNGRNRYPAESPVLYTVEAINSVKVCILASFTLRGGPASFVIDAKSRKGGIFADVKPFRVDFTQDGEQFVTIAVCVPEDFEKVYVSDQRWAWRYRIAGESNSESWLDLTETVHRIFVILHKPGSPWDTHGNSALDWPWVAALERVCGWAKDAASVNDAIKKVFEALTSNHLVYDTKKTFSYFVEHNYLQLGRIFDSVDDVPFAFQDVNCTDAAGIIVTLANLLGARLTDTVLTRLDHRLFQTNALRPLGGGADVSTVAFSYHEVALSPEEEVWDLCFKLDDGTGFGFSAGIAYRKYLNKLVHAEDFPNMRKRALIRNREVSPAPQVVAEFFSDVEFTERGGSAKARHGEARVFVHGLSLNRIKLDTWSIVRLQKRVFPISGDDSLLQSGDPFVRYFDTTWVLDPAGDQAIRLEIYIAPTRRYAARIGLKRGAEVGKNLVAKPSHVGPYFSNQVAIEDPRDNASGPVMEALANALCFARDVGKLPSPDGAREKVLKAMRELLLSEPDGVKKEKDILIGKCDLPMGEFDFTDYWWKFFCASGWLVSVRGRLMYFSGSGAPAETTIRAYAMDGVTAVKRIDLIVQPQQCP